MLPTATERTYVYLSVDLRTNEILGPVPFTSMTFTEMKNGMNSFRATTPLTTGPDPDDNNQINRELLLPGARKIVVVRDGIPVANNILWKANVSAVARNQVNFTGQGHWSYFAARRLRSPFTYTGDQFAAVQELLNHAQTSVGTDVGLTTSTGGLSGVVRTLKPLVRERRTYRGLIDEMANQDNGFDYLERATGTEATSFGTELRLATTLNHERPYVSVQIGRNARALSYSEDGYSMENVIDISSQTKTGEEAVFGTASDAASLAVYPQMDGYDRIELAPSQGAADLSATARQRLVSRSTPVRTLTIELETGIGAGSGISAGYPNTDIGSVFQVSCHYGWIDFQEDFVVESRSVTVNEDGEETIRLGMSNKF